MQTDEIEFDKIQSRVDVMVMLGVPYGEAVKSAEEMARAQALEIAQEVAAQGGPENLQTKKIIALTAYLQRMGRDIQAQPAPAPAEKVAHAGEEEGGVQ
jgi:cbb3-type cytochrome oxidase cytochrome c subunit